LPGKASFAFDAKLEVNELAGMMSEAPNFQFPHVGSKIHLSLNIRMARAVMKLFNGCFQQHV